MSDKDSVLGNIYVYGLMPAGSVGSCRVASRTRERQPSFDAKVAASAIIMPKRLFEVDIAARTRATRRRNAGFEISMLPVSMPAMLKVLLVATRVIRLSLTCGAALAVI